MMPGLPKFTILGGSSPFTIELINCFYQLQEGKVGPFELMLYGRNDANLQSVYSYARHYLPQKGWSVKCTTDIDCALDNASIVLHQNRYGGFKGRLDDENFSRKFNLPADETLGPSGLQSAIRMAPDLTLLAKKIVTYCPDALVINLTNPLSVAVSLLYKQGVSNVIGICELPITTIKTLSQSLSIPLESLEWSYTGLNHRGFIHDMKCEGKNLLTLFFEKNQNGFGGFDPSVIAHLEAIPTKYFHLLTDTCANVNDRAAALESLSSRIFDELSVNPLLSPIALKERNMDWYKQGLIPVLEAINSTDGNIVMVNKPREDGLTVESKFFVSKTQMVPITPAEAPIPVNFWMDIFLAHEQAVIDAAIDPSVQNISKALNLDLVLLKQGISTKKLVTIYFKQTYEQLA